MFLRPFGQSSIPSLLGTKMSLVVNCVTKYKPLVANGSFYFNPADSSKHQRLIFRFMSWQVINMQSSHKDKVTDFKCKTLDNSKSCVKLWQKLTIYKTLLRAIRTYGVQLFGFAKKNNLQKVQAFQSKCLRLITQTPSPFSNITLHTIFKIRFISDIPKSDYFKI